MSNFRDKLKQGGYDGEDAYFFKREQELIEKTREKTAQEAASRPQLMLLPGRKREDVPILPRGVTKKAA